MCKVKTTYYKSDDEALTKIEIFDEKGAPIPDMSFTFIDTKESNKLSTEISKSVEKIESLLRIMYNSGCAGEVVKFENTRIDV